MGGQNYIGGGGLRKALPLALPSGRSWGGRGVARHRDQPPGGGREKWEDSIVSVRE